MNIGAFEIEGNEWVNVADLGVTLEADTTYVIQAKTKTDFSICNKSTTPAELEGFYINHIEKLSYTHEEGNLYFKKVGSGKLVINIGK